MAQAVDPAQALAALADGLKADPRLTDFAQQLQALVPTLRQLAVPDVVMQGATQVPGAPGAAAAAAGVAGDAPAADGAPAAAAAQPPEGSAAR
eukprot:8868852-Pyramimonas_sp.AAC.1